MADGLLSLSWNNHKATFCHILSTLREKERYSDVTLACEGKFYPTHKLVLSTCSEYFEKMFENTPCKHPVILLSKDVRSDELEALLSYMYDGVVSVAQNDLSRLIKVAELLQIKGLAVPDEPPQPKKNYAREDRSPHPKRRKRDESLSNIPPDKALGDSTLHVSEGEHLTREGGTTDVDVSQRQEITPKHEINRVQNEGNIEETLVKEEVVETVDDAAVKDHSLEFSSEAGGNSSIVDNDQKFLQSQPLHEAVVEVLAGPSGMQGWLGTGDMGGSFPLLETYSEEGTQQETPHPVPVSVAQPAHPLVGPNIGKWMPSGTEDPEKIYKCPFCSHTTVRRDYLSQHIRTHTGEKPYSCLFCSHKSSTKYAMNVHLRKHTGEKPYKCVRCGLGFAQKPLLNNHIVTCPGSRHFVL